MKVAIIPRRRWNQVLILACCLTLLFTQPMGVQAQLFGGRSGGGFFANLLGALGDVVSGITQFVSNAIEAVIESVAAAVLGGDPDTLVCEAVQSGLDEQGINCTCGGAADIISRDVDIYGTCSIPNCPADNFCGTCSISYQALGKIKLSDESMTGLADIYGNCNFMGTGDLAGETQFELSVTVDYAGGGDTDLELSIKSCSVDVWTYRGRSVNAPCECSSDTCTGSLEVAYTCNNGVDFDIASDGCISIAGFLDGDRIRN